MRFQFNSEVRVYFDRDKCTLDIDMPLRRDLPGEVDEAMRALKEGRTPRQQAELREEIIRVVYESDAMEFMRDALVIE